MLTVAIPGDALVQPPPVTEELNEVVAPGHTVATPVIVPGSGVVFTVTTFVATLVPQLLVTE